MVVDILWSREQSDKRDDLTFVRILRFLCVCGLQKFFKIYCFVLTIVFDACALFVAERKERAYYERVYHERDYARKRKTFTMRERELLGGFYSRKSK